jgi:hypothetical protein
MNLAAAFTQINWLSVLVSAIAAFAVGGLWYSPVLFGKAWQTLIKVTNEELKNASMVMIFGTTFILNIIGAAVLDMFIGPMATIGFGLLAGLIISVIWIGSSLAINYLYARKPFKLFLIDAGYYVTFYAIMGIILGVWK